MPLNHKKIVEIFKSQVDQIPERCKDYCNEVLLTLVDIIDAERAHKVNGTNIQQRVIDKCNTLGGLLAKETADRSPSQAVK